MREIGLEVAGLRRCSLLELDNWSCRWPVGTPGSPDFYFCGAPEADLALSVPYCRRCTQLAYRRLAA